MYCAHRKVADRDDRGEFELHSGVWGTEIEIKGSTYVDDGVGLEPVFEYLFVGWVEHLVGMEGKEGEKRNKEGKNACRQRRGF